MTKLRSFRIWVLLVSAIVISEGCKTGHFPNPNDPADVGPLSPDTVRRNLKAVTDSLTQRLISGEIDDKKYRALVAKAAEEIAGDADPSSIKPSQAWEYGEVLRDARQWRLAEPVLRLAVDNAIKTKNEDRRVNDSLRLATVLACENKVPEAIKTARSVFDAPPAGTAPILLGTYLDLVPVARGKGDDADLAKLVEDAIAVELTTKVDTKTESGQAFMAARKYHVGRAWMCAAELYDAAGKRDLAALARAKAIAAGVRLRSRSEAGAQVF